MNLCCVMGAWSELGIRDGERRRSMRKPDQSTSTLHCIIPPLLLEPHESLVNLLRVAFLLSSITVAHEVIEDFAKYDTALPPTMTVSLCHVRLGQRVGKQLESNKPPVKLL